MSTGLLAVYDTDSHRIRRNGSVCAHRGAESWLGQRGDGARGIALLVGWAGWKPGWVRGRCHLVPGAAGRRRPPTPDWPALRAGREAPLDGQRRRGADQPRRSSTPKSFTPQPGSAPRTAPNGWAAASAGVYLINVVLCGCCGSRESGGLSGEDPPTGRPVSLIMSAGRRHPVDEPLVPCGAADRRPRIRQDSLGS
jgi:hypothetical protein